MKQQTKPSPRPSPNKRPAPPSGKRYSARQKSPPPKKENMRTALLHRLSQLLSLPARPDGEVVVKGVVCGALILFFALLQTTVFARFRPFGAIPDLMLPLVIALALTEGEKWGAVLGLIAAVVIESLGGVSPYLLPLLYVPCGYFCPILCELYLSDSIPVRAIFTAVSGLGRAVITLFCLALTLDSFPLTTLLSTIVLPEFAATAVMAPLTHVLVRLIMHPFHKSRAERVKTI